MSECALCPLAEDAHTDHPFVSTDTLTRFFDTNVNFDEASGALSYRLAVKGGIRAVGAGIMTPEAMIAWLNRYFPEPS